MTEPLQSARRGPEKAGSVVVFLHGYGADGTDLLGLSEPLAPHLPTTAFYAPDAPEPSRNNPMGFQWFQDGRSEISSQSRSDVALTPARLSMRVSSMACDLTRLFAGRKARCVAASLTPAEPVSAAARRPAPAAS